MTTFRLDEKGDIWMTFWEGGQGGTINLSEHIRQIVRKEVERPYAAPDKGEKK